VSILPTGIIVVNKEKKIVYMNPYARDAIVGKKAFGKDIMIYHDVKEKREKIESFFSSLIDNESVELPIVKIINLGGKSSLYMVRLTKLYDEESKFSGIVAIFYDMSTLAFSEIPTKDNGVSTIVKKLPVLLKDKMVFLDVQEIVFVRSVGSSSLLFDIEGDRYYSNLKISELEDTLKSNGFFRSHKSYLINLAYLKEMHCKDGKCKLFLQASRSFFVPISRRNRTKLSKVLSIR
jgi:hypothetical protein